MSSTSNANKIINQAARAVFQKEGLFQKGSSRIWIDDNGWFLIVVEFQPSGWNQGAYLNVGIHYLWGDQDYLTIDYGGRVGGFVELSEDASEFRSSMQALSEKALERVLEYRRFRDFVYARKQILKNDNTAQKIHQLYQSMMICGLCSDPEAVRYFRLLMAALESPQTDWQKAYYIELTEHIAPIINCPSSFNHYILAKIKRQRNMWRAKSAMKKLREDFDMFSQY